ncbi:MAG: hypothetical protein H6900_02185 [Rhodobacter sp.]|uniref:hypothetical protein n=1 Tax=Pararhodobacter sp. TaxID=2127056 RepID=UPI001D5FFD32|nr:hypothetical protein [Pararhodobacter sp.]MCB1344885.1 hypothetical protein [Paracoccaceae bacterium]MCC0072076.1 hypothetical protein [Rhodobacter sp.]HPD93849.1 hypothetical protein [Pararhodobacter sp.]
MDRRSFLTALAGGFGAGAAALAGPAFADGLDLRLTGDPRAVRMHIRGTYVTLSALVVQDGARAFGTRWAGGAPAFDEDRADLSATPVIGGLFRPTFRNRWVAALPLGTVTLTGDTLVATLDEAARLAGTRAVLGVGPVSWDLPGPLLPVTRMAEGASAGALRLGRDGRLLIALPQAQPAP